MAYGFVRRLDSLGRVTIPKEFRRSLELEEFEPMDMYIVDKVIHLIPGKGRRLDELGRYTVPIEVRRTLRFEQNEFVDIYIENNEICIKKEMLQCVICGADEEDKLIEVEGVLICRSCAGKIADKLLEV